MSRDYHDCHGKSACVLDLEPDWLVGCRVCNTTKPAVQMIVHAVSSECAEFVCADCHDSWCS